MYGSSPIDMLIQKTKNIYIVFSSYVLIVFLYRVIYKSKQLERMTQVLQLIVVFLISPLFPFIYILLHLFGARTITSGHICLPVLTNALILHCTIYPLCKTLDCFSNMLIVVHRVDIICG